MIVIFFGRGNFLTDNFNKISILCVLFPHWNNGFKQFHSELFDNNNLPLSKLSEGTNLEADY